MSVGVRTCAYVRVEVLMMCAVGAYGYACNFATESVSIVTPPLVRMFHWHWSQRHRRQVQMTHLHSHLNVALLSCGSPLLAQNRCYNGLLLID